MHASPVSPPEPRKKGWPTWLVVLVAFFGFAFVGLPFFAVFGVYGVRKYIANAKMAEARNTLATLATDATLAYERDHATCPSASHPVPPSIRSVSGAKYQSVAAEWEADRAQKAGFACLGFSIAEPQYFQYSYAASPDGFEATAHGDLNGDGKVSTFTIRGEVKGGALVIAPAIEESDPQE